jgi:hypothetical protein
MFWQKMKEKSLPLMRQLSLLQTYCENSENLGALKYFVIPLHTWFIKSQIRKDELPGPYFKLTKN